MLMKCLWNKLVSSAWSVSYITSDWSVWSYHLANHPPQKKHISICTPKRFRHPLWLKKKKQKKNFWEAIICFWVPTFKGELKWTRTYRQSGGTTSRHSVWRPCDKGRFTKRRFCTDLLTVFGKSDTASSWERANTSLLRKDGCRSGRPYASASAREDECLCV